MEATLTEFLTSHFVPFLVFSLVVYAVSTFIRLAAEMLHPKLRETSLTRSRVWRELILPVTPIVLGALLALGVTAFPYPTEFKDIWAGRLMYGAALGLFSTWVYRVIKVIVRRKWDVELPDLDARSASTNKPTEEIST